MDKIGSSIDWLAKVNLKKHVGHFWCTTDNVNFFFLLSVYVPFASTTLWLAWSYTIVEACNQICVLQKTCQSSESKFYMSVI